MPERFPSLALALVASGSVAALLSAQAVPAAQPGPVSFPNVIDPILEAWANTPSADFPNYPAGAWGPESAEALIARDGRSDEVRSAVAPLGELLSFAVDEHGVQRCR